MTIKERRPDYRVRFITRSLFPVILFPFSIPIILTFTRLIPYLNEGKWYKILALSFFSTFIWNVIWIQWESLRQRREAKRLGARLVPRYRGRWPGNLDFIYDSLKRAKDGYMGDFIEKTLRDHNTTTLNLRLLWTDKYLTADESVVKYILATGFENFDKGWRAQEVLEDFLGNGIFNRDGEIWKSHRALARPFFARERVRDFETFEKHAAKTIELIDAHSSRSTAIDAQDLFARFTLDTGAEFLFNTSTDTLSLPLPKAGLAKMGPKGSAIEGEFGTFAKAFETVQQCMLDRRRLDPIWPMFELFTNKCDEPMTVIKEWLDPIVRNTLEANHQKKMRGEEVKDMENCSFMEYMAAEVNDVEMIREELLNILLAARDTTASLLTFTIYMFTQHSEILERVRAEILSICSESTVPTYDDLRSMKYLRAVLNETLRLWPPVPGNGRGSLSSPCLIPTAPTSDFSNPPSSNAPLYIPEDTDVIFSTFLIHRRKDLWGEDADVFDPERWLDPKRLERMIKNPLIFVPFNAGPRICLGQQFAFNEASFLLVRLLQKYAKFELATECQPKGSIPPEVWKTRDDHGRASIERIWPSSALTLYVRGGLWIRTTKA